MPDDIYTRLPIVEDSSEHVLLDALGGRLQVRGIIDRKTNSRFGEGIDAALEQGLRVIRVFLDAPNSRGEPPAALVGVRAEDGVYDVASGGVVRPRPVVRNFDWKGRDLTLDVTVPDERALRDMLRKKARQRGVDLNQLIARLGPLAENRRAAMPQMEFSFGVWEAEAYRTTAKTACNLFAHRHADWFRDASFDDIRAFILNGTKPPLWPVQVADLDLGHSPLGRFDHLVKVGVSEGAVRGLVVYFGHLAFIVHIGRAPSGLDVKRSYRVDQLSGQDRVDAPDDLAIVLPSFDEAAAKTYEEFAALAHQQGERLIREAHAHQETLWLRRILRPHWDQLAAQHPDGSTLTAEEARTFAAAVASDLTAELLPSIVRAAEARRHAAERGLQDVSTDDDE